MPRDHTFDPTLAEVLGTTVPRRRSSWRPTPGAFTEPPAPTRAPDSLPPTRLDRDEAYQPPSSANQARSWLPTWWRLAS